MRKKTLIHDAIDKSLQDVHFSAQDMHSVLRQTRMQQHEIQPQKTSTRGRPAYFGYALAAAMLIVIIAPVSFFALRGQSRLVPTTNPLCAAPGEAQSGPHDAVSDGDPLSAAPSASITASPLDDGVFDERDAIAAARACFETQCDTSVFAFEEYDVTLAEAGSDSDAPDSFVVEMNSIYDNGCSFRVVLSRENGDIISYSTPRLATTPMYLNTQSAEVLAWYEQYGPHMFTWPMDAQAEFSRRYEGAALRMPREGEVDAETIAKRFGSHIHVSELTSDPDEHQLTYYTTLYSERSSADGVARYQVYCFAGGEITDTLPPVFALITFRASDGEFESKQILSTSGL